MTTDSSLRIGLLIRFGVGVAVLLTLGAITSYYTALHATDLAYDRWLIDSTRSLSTAIHINNNQINFDLQRDALDVFRFDELDKTYFRISSLRRGFISGDKALADLAVATVGQLKLGNRVLDGEQIREVTMQIALPTINDTVTISVAETLFKRTKATREIVLAMVAPQIGLLGIAAILSWLSIIRGLKPLTDLAAVLERRDYDNFTPVQETNLPHEARVLASRINDLLKRVSRALDLQKRFVADAAHQLRTPLAAIMLQAERAVNADDAVTATAALQTLNVSVQRAARLSQQLLILASAEPNATAVQEFSTLNLSTLARKVGEEWIPVALERNIDFGLSVPELPIWIHGSEHLLSELLSNLIDNALHYVQAGGAVTVSIVKKDRVTLSVEDNGPGIATAEKYRIFERFYRVPGTVGEGCGLGLAIVAEIAAVHGAMIDVAPGAAGKGAIFSVHFQNKAPAMVMSGGR